jgi:DNA modification methylase
MTPRKEVLAEGVEIWCGDMLEILPTLGRFDACVTDPPYGIGEAAGKARTRTSGLSSKLRNASAYRRDYGDDKWDDKPISQEALELILRRAKWQIVFGGNYYSLPPTSCWLVWDKLNGETDFADCELAWTNLPKAVRRFRYLWNGCMRMERGVDREHPTQKPIGVMEWVISHLPPDVGTILDPFMGSGTTGVAAIKRGKHFTGIEREPKYFDIARRRISDALKSPDLFIEQPKPIARQEALAL